MLTMLDFIFIRYRFIEFYFYKISRFNHEFVIQGEKKSKLRDV